MDNLSYLPLNDEQRRVLQDALQLDEALTEAGAHLQHFRGSYAWKTVKGREYLYRATRSGQWRSVGPRSPETEAILDRFTADREAAQQRANALSDRMDLQSKYLTANRLGRLPEVTGRVIAQLALSGFDFRVIGTTALAAYEVVAGVHFVRDLTATTDVDLMFDGRKRLTMVAGEAPEPRAILATLQKVDATFRRSRNLFRATSADGFMVDIACPAWRPMQVNPHIQTGADDLAPAEIEGLEWLANAPELSTTAFTLRGRAVPLKVPDPRFFAVHKVFVAGAAEREPIKAKRDLAQARAVARLVEHAMPWLPFNDPALSVFPDAVRREAEAALEVTLPHGPPSGRVPSP